MTDASAERDPHFCSLPSYHNSTTTMFAPKNQPQSALPDRFSANSDYSEKNFVRLHHHSLSESSTFCSTDSSPTTTCSTLDDSSVTEPSPESSPESPPPATYQMGMDRCPQSADDDKPGAFFELQRVAPAVKKGRNLKNLAVNTSRTTGQAASLTGLLPGQLQRQESAPSILSPAFVKPPEPQRRRPSNLGLTILTPSNNKASSPKQIRLAIPPTPGFSRPPTLRHFQSSPSLPLLTGFGAITTVGANDTRLGALDTIFSPLEIVPKSHEVLREDEQNFDIPLSREDKPEAYPDGPICVFPPYIDLYLEPTAEQARRYDVILNVASEVPNPLDDNAVSQSQEQQLRIDGGGGIQYAPNRRPSALSTEEEFNGSPTTPKATPQAGTFSLTTRRTGPEYIHIPWEHNSDIVPDLLRLCKLIDERVQEQKRVLIHCQCGVSRSASLVVAYGLYKNPSMSVQEAYDAVKQQSKWIGPNMNLIMQLQEYRSSLARGGVLSGNRGLSPITPTSALSDWAGPFSARANDIGPHSDSVSARSHPPPTSRSEHFESSVTSPIVPPHDPWTAANPTRRTRAGSTLRTASAYVDPAGHVVPVLSIIEPPSAISETVQRSGLSSSTSGPLSAINLALPELSSPRAAEFAMTALTPPKAVDAADTFGVMSPTSTEVTNPFDRSSLLAQLGMTTHTQHPAPKRTRSLKVQPDQGLSAPRKLRGKISSPSLREQHHLHNIQAQLEAQLPRRHNAEEPSGMDAALMSPRATEFTQNPFALAFNSHPTSLVATTGVVAAPAIDPRSPAQKGASPIIRSIEDFL